LLLAVSLTSTFFANTVAYAGFGSFSMPRRVAAKSEWVFRAAEPPSRANPVLLEAIAAHAPNLATKARQFN
jgi:hypothetical protein